MEKLSEYCLEHIFAFLTPLDWVQTFQGNKVIIFYFIFTSNLLIKIKITSVVYITFPFSFRSISTVEISNIEAMEKNHRNYLSRR